MLGPSRYKGAYGGRGSGKSHFFAEMLVEDAYRFPGLRAVCVREVQQSLKESAKKLIEDKIQTLGLGFAFEPLQSEIRTPGGGSILFQGMKDHTAESIKSLEGMDRAWVEEAQTLSERSWRLLRPTIRKDGSEIWASWNPRFETDPVDAFFRSQGGEGVVSARSNWNNNPWFPAVLEDERLRDLENDPDGYEHTWEGDYARILKGSYYAQQIVQAEKEGRICNVPYEPALPVSTFWDLGIGDAMAIWFVQRVGRELRHIDYYETSGEGMSYYAKYLKDKPYVYERHYMPHDANHKEIGTGKSRRDVAEALGIKPIDVVPIGAVDDGINATRMAFSRCWFDANKCKQGLNALRAYRKEWDEDRQEFKNKPLHDWSSHAADALRTRASSDFDDGSKDFSPIITSTYFDARQVQRRDVYSDSKFDPRRAY